MPTPGGTDPVASTSARQRAASDQILFPRWPTWSLMSGQCCSLCQPALFKVYESRFLTVYRGRSHIEKDENCLLCGVLEEARTVGWRWHNARREAPSDLPLDSVSLRYASPSAVSLVCNSTHEMFPGPLETRSIISIEQESTQHPQEETNSTSPLSLEGLSFIRDQLNNCTSNPAHDCKLPMIVDKARWPARLLQVRDQSVVLVDFDTNVMPGEFAALSYSWGSASELKLNPPYKATSSTVQALYAGIDVSQLPMTIQHALWLTKELKIQYIWIDSLCIIQDSKQDWEVEAAKMQTVYAMSKVTIIAASSTSCHSGFLRVKRESHQLRNPFPSPFRFMIRPGCESGLHKLASSWEDSHDPLETRGWTFQEEMLSSRYIKFTKDDIQWRCSAGFTCLCGGRPDEECIGLWRAIENPSLETMAWETLVREFSHRRFTKDTDKLVSLSSLARKIAPVFSVPTGQTPYIAGLWRIALVIQLNWSVELTIGEHIDSYVAPSFSWASIRFSRYGIRFRGSPQHVLCRVLDADTTKVYEGNEFGAVSAGFARLYGPFIGCTMRFQEGNAELLIPQEMTLEVGSSMRLDCQLCEHILDDGSKTLQRATSQKQQESGEFSVGILILGQSPAWKGHEANCLILGYMGNDKYQRLGLVEPIYERRSGFPPMYFERLMKEVILI